MSEMKRINLTENKSVPLGDSTNNVNLLAAEEHLALMITNTIGGGTVNVRKWSKDLEAFVTIASFTAVTAEAEKIHVGRGRTELQLVGATSPNLNIDYWWM